MENVYTEIYGGLGVTYIQKIYGGARGPPIPDLPSLKPSLEAEQLQARGKTNLYINTQGPARSVKQAIGDHKTNIMDQINEPLA